MVDKQKILDGRKGVFSYRDAHTKLHKDKPWHKGVPEEHTPLLEKMLVDLKEQGLNSLSEFFSASDELNIQELGFKDKADFETKGTKANRETLKGMWH